jgi:dihydrofolate reductase
MIISMIAAMSENRVIGQGNSLPWHLPADLRYFKEKTLGHAVIMGRKTFESVGRPLPRRRNVVVTRNRDFQFDRVETVGSIEEALELLENEEEVFIVGGGEVYRQSFDLADKLYLTVIYHQFEGDTFFPEFDESRWSLIEKVDFPADSENPYPFSFLTYRKSVNEE